MRARVHPSRPQPRLQSNFPCRNIKRKSKSHTSLSGTQGFGLIIPPINKRLFPASMKPLLQQHARQVCGAQTLTGGVVKNVFFLPCPAYAAPPTVEGYPDTGQPDTRMTGYSNDRIPPFPRLVQAMSCLVGENPTCSGHARYEDTPAPAP